MGAQELIGKVIIQENIDTIDENKIPKTFVINVPDPYKNYYGRFTEVEKPNSIIFITKTQNSFEKILRVTNKLNKKHNLKLQGAKCEVKIGSRKLDGVRIKGLRRYHEIEKIQEYYLNEGFEFAKSEKFQNVEALIRINRFFNIQEMEKGIYHCKDEVNTYYIEVPKFMNWEEFRRITFEIKNNIAENNYDIAKGIFYVNDGVVEMLRLIKPKVTIELLRAVQKKYIEKLQ